MRAAVLIVEDDMDLSRQYELALSLVNIQPEVKRDGKKAMERIQDGEAPAVVILDLHLPNVSGEEIFAEMRRRDLGSKVVVITADEALADEFRGKVQQVILKPTNLEQFIQVVLHNLKEQEDAATGGGG